jgi:hypothetical protein
VRGRATEVHRERRVDKRLRAAAVEAAYGGCIRGRAALHSLGQRRSRSRRINL